MLDTNSLKNVTFEITEANKSKAVKVYTVADFLDVGSNPLAIELSEAKKKLSELATSKIAEANTKIKGSVNGVYSAISTLDIINKSVSAYRSIKPKVKLAVNIGGIWRNFSNIGEIAQDAVQLAFRGIVGEGKKVLEDQLIKLLSTPIMLQLGDGSSTSADASKIVLDKYKEYEDKYKKLISDYISNLSLDDFLELVRIANDNILKNFTREKKNYWFSSFYEDKIYDISYKDGLYYLVFSNRIDTYNLNTLSQNTILEKENLNGIHFINEDMYYSTSDGLNTVIYKNETTLGTVIGRFLKFDDFENTILISTDNGIYKTDSLTSLYSGEIIDSFSISVGIYATSKTQIKYFQNLNDSGSTLHTLSEGEITGISYLDGIIFSVKNIDGSITLKRFFDEIEIAKKECNQSGFSFVKMVNGKLLAYKNKTLYEITEYSGALTSKSITTNLPGDISDIDYISISGAGYYVTSVGTSLFVADTRALNIWEEKIIDYESTGEVGGVVTSIKVDGSTVYFSSLKKIFKISDNSKLLPSTPYIAPDILSGIITQVVTTPNKGEEPELIESIPIIFVKEYDSIIYKILTKDIISYGSYIENSDVKVISQSENIYSFAMKNTDYFYAQKKNIYINNDIIKNFNSDSIIISIVNYNDNILFFTETECFTSTENSISTVSIETIFKINEKCKMCSDGNSILVVERNKIFSITSNNTINELIQIKDSVNKISIAGGKTFLFTENELLSVSKNNIISQSEKYHNGYKINSHYEKGVGIAPFDLKSNIIKNIFLSKKNFISSLNPEFEEHFILLMDRIPYAVLEKIEKDLFPSVSSGETTSSPEEIQILNSLKASVLQSINGLFSSIMKNNFSLGLEESDKFVDELNKRLENPGRNEITDEFYFIANAFVKNFLVESVHQMNSLDIWNLVWEYYNRHKYEWGERINTEINKSFIPENIYNFAIDETAETELKSHLNTLLNVTCKAEIEAFVLGKTGTIPTVDKEYLKSIISTKSISSITDMASASTWIEKITECVSTLYIPSQYHEYTQVIDDSNMYPIQWQELPDFISRETFDKLLTILLDLIKVEMKEGIKILVEDGDIVCFSCVEPSILYKEVKRKIDNLFTIHKKSCENKVYNSTTYEDVYKNFYILSGSYTKEYLKEVLNGQTKLYSKYINSFVDAIIESSQENYVEGVE